ncbi:hypothetical protein OSTOST_23921, partial [Ostertagia ostertagi]
MLSTIDSSNLTPINTEMTPQMQLRTILRRRGVNSAVKRAIENASGLLRVRYDALLSFVRTQENCEELQQEVDRFWKEQQGEKLLEDAQILITAVDAQLLMDESLENILSQQPSDEVVTATAALTISDTGRPQDNQPAQEHQNPNQDALPSTPKQDTPCSVLQPIQLRRLELPTFDGDVTKFHDFWCRFRTAVHDNPTLPLSTKFIYLTNSLKGQRSTHCSRLRSIKPENYQLAVEALRRRYDRPKFTHNLFHQRLEQLPASSHSASAQRDTLSQIQSFILQLNRYEDTTTSLALEEDFMKKFPRETQLEVYKLEHRSGKTWTLPELLDGLNEQFDADRYRDDTADATPHDSYVGKESSLKSVTTHCCPLFEPGGLRRTPARSRPLLEGTTRREATCLNRLLNTARFGTILRYGNAIRRTQPARYKRTLRIANQDALPSTPKQDTPCSVLQPIQLRRLELPTFDGDVTKFHDFWCRFRAAVAMITLLLPFVDQGSAALIVQGYDPSTPENYQLAVEALRRRYDRPQVYPQPFPIR